MQQTQVAVVREVQVGLWASTAVFPVWVPVPMRTAVWVPTVPVTAAMSAAAVMTAATCPK